MTKREGVRGYSKIWRNPFLWKGPRGSCAPVNPPYRALQSCYSVASETDRQTNKAGLDLSQRPKSSPISPQSAHWPAGACAMSKASDLWYSNTADQRGEGQGEIQGVREVKGQRQMGWGRAGGMVQCLILSTYCKSPVWRMDYSITKVVLDIGKQKHNGRKRLEVL